MSAFLALSPLGPLALVYGATGNLVLSIVDRQTEQPLAARMHLTDARGRSIRPRGTVRCQDHFVIDQRLALNLRPGLYSFQLDCGPEYKTRMGHFEIQKLAHDEKILEMDRFVNMEKLGWWSGDLDVRRQVRHVELLMRAEDLHVTPVLTWEKTRTGAVSHQPSRKFLRTFDKNRFSTTLAGRIELSGVSVGLFNWEADIDRRKVGLSFGGEIERLCALGQNEEIHIDLQHPDGWDAPVLLATGIVDSIGVINSSFLRSGMHYATDREERRVPTRDLYPEPHGLGRWSESIYYHLLNCGLHLPPSAGSGSGATSNPPGINRTYVYCGSQVSYAKWWENLRRGRVFVTNGPLLRTTVAGRLPGYIFRIALGETLRLKISLSLWTREKIDYLEVVRNGRPEFQVRLDEWAQGRGELPELEFRQSGWFLVRAVTSSPKTYRLALTGPFYVEVGGQRRVSRRSANFFLNWVKERIRRMDSGETAPQTSTSEVYLRAQKFWQEIVDKANAA